MKKTKQWILTGMTLCAGAAAALYRKLRNKQPASDTVPEVVTPELETPEEVFRREWASTLEENARVFNGLYNGLWRVHSGSAKKPEKVLREWSQRTHYKWENEQADILCQQNIVPLIEAEDREGLTKWADLLLEAAAAAEILREEAQTLVLTEENADAYVEWDGKELYPEDEIEIITSAWYQNGKLLEQGQCKKTNEEEE